MKYTSQHSFPEQKAELQKSTGKNSNYEQKKITHRQSDLNIKNAIPNLFGIFFCKYNKY